MKIRMPNTSKRHKSHFIRNVKSLDNNKINKRYGDFNDDYEELNDYLNMKDVTRTAKAPKQEIKATRIKKPEKIYTADKIADRPSVYIIELAELPDSEYNKKPVTKGFEVKIKYKSGSLAADDLAFIHDEIEDELGYVTRVNHKKEVDGGVEKLTVIYKKNKVSEEKVDEKKDPVYKGKSIDEINDEIDEVVRKEKAEKMTYMDKSADNEEAYRGFREAISKFIDDMVEVDRNAKKLIEDDARKKKEYEPVSNNNRNDDGNPKTTSRYDKSNWGNNAVDDVYGVRGDPKKWKKINDGWDEKRRKGEYVFEGVPLEDAESQENDSKYKWLERTRKKQLTHLGENYGFFSEFKRNSAGKSKGTYRSKSADKKGVKTDYVSDRDEVTSEPSGNQGHKTRINFRYARGNNEVRVSTGTNASNGKLVIVYSLDDGVYSKIGKDNIDNTVGAVASSILKGDINSAISGYRGMMQ